VVFLQIILKKIDDFLISLGRQMTHFVETSNPVNVGFFSQIRDPGFVLYLEHQIFLTKPLLNAVL